MNDGEFNDKFEKIQRASDFFKQLRDMDEYITKKNKELNVYSSKNPEDI